MLEVERYDLTIVNDDIERALRELRGAAGLATEPGAES